MSSFFTQPASQQKRKRDQDTIKKNARRKVNGTLRKDSSNGGEREKSRRKHTNKDDDDESISGSDSDAVEYQDAGQESDAASSSSSEDEGDAADRRAKLASRYLENTRREILAEGFDAKDIDNEILAARMGERLKQETAETKGKLYRWIANDYSYSTCRSNRFNKSPKTLQDVAVCFPYVYTISQDLRLTKWQLQPQIPGVNSSMVTGAVTTVRGDKSKRKDISYQGHVNEIYCIAASSDGKFVATGGKDKRLVIWDAETLKVLRVFTQHRDAITSLSFRRSTNQLFTASKDRTIKIWSLDELAYVETLYGHQDEVMDVDSLNQEHCVTVGARDKTARYWKVVEENQLIFRGGGAHNSLAKKQRLEDTNGDHIQSHIAYHEGSTDRVAMIDEDTFITGSDNGSLSLWSITKKKAVFTYPLAHGVDIPTNPELYSAEEHPDSTKIPNPTPRWITSLAALPYSNIFFTGSWDGHIRAWKITEDKRQIESLGPISTTPLKNHEGSDTPRRMNGIVNGIALFEWGYRGKDGIGLVAVTGKQHRYGRWQKVSGQNEAIIFQIPKIVNNNINKPE